MVPRNHARLSPLPRLRHQLVTVLLAGACVSVAKGEEKPSPLAFGSPRAPVGTRSFGDADTGSDASQRASDRDRAYARGLLKKYDADKDGALQEDEWRKIRGNLEAYDTNNDGKIIYDELLARATGKRRENEVTRRNKWGDRRRSYRLTKPSLPSGLPSWFADRDADGDGQVAMHEYSRRWTDSTARRFLRFDKNDDGLITPSEALD
ncbi:MAG: hypothetical protein AAF266_04725 [Planctomycetota bacterium]